MEKLKDFFRDKQVTTLLDVGTGTGDFIEVLKDSIEYLKVTGVDPSKESLEKAATKYPEVDFKEMGAEMLVFNENHFDAASISMALHHLPDIKKSLTEMQRVVKPGGWIIVNELYSDNLNEAQKVHRLYHHFSSSVDAVLGISHNPTFKKNEIIEMVEKSGIKIHLHFDHKKEENQIKNKADIDERIEKMETMLQQIEGHSEYQNLKPKIEEFRTKVEEYGFEPATRVVIVGSVQK